jgi:hypothetical protein
MLMASPNDERAVTDDPATGLHLVPNTNFRREQNSPGWAPEFGDAQELQMQMDILDCIPPAIIPARAKVRFIDKIKQAIRPVQEIYPEQAILASNPKLLSAAELHQLYAGTSVPAHRYLAGLLSTAVNSPAIALDPEKWLAGISVVDLPSVVADWLNTNKSTAYEQLNSIGLDANTSRLTGVLTVKQRSGYAGGPSTAGSREFVTFWVDWGSGFQYEGTTSVAVHDFSSLPAAGLEYKVFLPVDVLAHAQPGRKGAKKVKVRAVLSWNTPPSTTDPCAPVIWGNSLDGVILIPPGINVSSGARSSLKDAPAGSCLRAMC